MLDFHLKENGTSVKTEILAGLTTFLSMAYILALYPSIMSDIPGFPAGGSVIAVALATVIGTCLMAFLAKYPFGLAPGVGTIPFFAYVVVKTMGISWQFAMMAVFLEGVIFIALSVTPVREKLFDVIPLPLKNAISVGLGFFLIYIALQGAKIIVDGPCYTTLVNFHENFQSGGICAVLALIGVVILAMLYHYNVKGSILLGILITWVLGMLCQATGLYTVDPAHGMYSLYPTLNLDSLGKSFSDFGRLFGACFDVGTWSINGETGWQILFSANFLLVLFVLLFSDLFNTIGTLTGIAATANMLDKNGSLPRAKEALLADAIATTTGAVCGATTTTTYVESATGVAVGGRTGLTAYVTSALFLLSILIAPVFTAIPSFAIAPALIMVGYLMSAQITKINFGDLAEAFPCLFAIIILPFSYNIADGICFGFIFWTAFNLLLGRKDRVNLFMIIMSVLFVLKYIFL